LPNTGLHVYRKSIKIPFPAVHNNHNFSQAPNCEDVLFSWRCWSDNFWMNVDVFALCNWLIYRKKAFWDSIENIPRNSVCCIHWLHSRLDGSLQKIWRKYQMQVQIQENTLKARILTTICLVRFVYILMFENYCWRHNSSSSSLWRNLKCNHELHAGVLDYIRHNTNRRRQIAPCKRTFTFTSVNSTVARKGNELSEPKQRMVFLSVRYDNIGISFFYRTNRVTKYK
jgi:hypothetical protein